MRHIGAYIDLAGLDLARTHREITAQVVASAIVAICALFAVFLICLGIVAYFWDTPYRLAAIACLAGVFVLAAIAAAIYPGARGAGSITAALRCAARVAGRSRHSRKDFVLGRGLT